jgi:hypothetical protein
MALAVIALLAAGCGSISIGLRTFGAATVEDLQAEENYKSVYAEQIGRLHSDIVAFAASGSNPGVCNVGGSASDCFAADAKAIDVMRALIGALQAITVPPRFAEADRLLRAAFAQQIEGLELRNQALTYRDDALWTKHATVLQAATTALQRAYAAFPVDNRPVPAP